MVGKRTRGAGLEEIELVYRRRVNEFRRVARAIVGDRDLARDAVQEAFANAVRKRASFRGEGPLEAWLWRSVVHSALASVRNAAARPTLPLAGRADVPAADGDSGTVDERVRAAVAGLPERQRLALFLHYYADLDYHEVAGVLGVAVGTVGASLSAARASLRRALEEVEQRELC